MAPTTFPLKDVLEKYLVYQRSNQSTAISAQDTELKLLAEAFHQLSVEKTGADYSPDPLETLDPERATLPFLFILAARIKLAATKQTKSSYPATLKPGSKLWVLASTVLTKGDPVEARYAEDSWQTLIETIAQSAAQSSDKNYPPETSVAIAATGILRMDPSGGTLTTSHLELVRSSLFTRCYDQAKPVLDREIHSLPTTEARPNDAALNATHPTSNAYLTVADQLSGELTLEDVLEYYTLAAMVYIGLQEWARAMHLLEHVLCTPSREQGHAHALQVEAYKKWVLTSLLAHGKLVGLPKPASASAMRTARSLSKEYEAVADAFKGTDHKRLAAEVHEAESEFYEACNDGLVRFVVAKHRELVVSKLASTYSRVSFGLVAQRLGISDGGAREYVQELVQQGLLEASIEKEDASRRVLRFNNAGLQKPEQQVRAELELQTRRIKELSEQVAEADQRLSMSKEWIEHTVKQGRSKGHAHEVQPDEEAMDMSFGGVGSDEDEESIMADVG